MRRTMFSGGIEVDSFAKIHLILEPKMGDDHQSFSNRATLI